MSRQTSLFAFLQPVNKENAENNTSRTKKKSNRQSPEIDLDWEDLDVPLASLTSSKPSNLSTSAKRSRSRNVVTKARSSTVSEVASNTKRRKSTNDIGTRKLVGPFQSAANVLEDKATQPQPIPRLPSTDTSTPKDVLKTSPIPEERSNESPIPPAPTIQANVPSIRRIMGMSDLGEFQSTSLLSTYSSTQRRPMPTKQNLATRLCHRSTTGCAIAPFQHHAKNWKEPSWFHLDSLDGSGSKVECLAWDPMGGILLAVAYSQNNRSPRNGIRIYDWDMVRAADIVGKSEHQRFRRYRHRTPEKNASEQMDTPQTPPASICIPPIIEFPVPHPISTIKWNPFDPDELAVGFKRSGKCHLYALEKISAWIEAREARQRRGLDNNWGSSASSSNMPSPDCYRQLQHRTLSGTVQTLEYLDANHVVASAGHSVYCWKQLKNDNLSSNTIPPYWRLKLSSICSCARRLPGLNSSLVLFGTTDGSFVLVDWTTTTRERNFSSELAPTILHRWSPLSKCSESTRSIVGLHLSSTTSSSCVPIHESFEGGSLLEITCLTKAGLLVSTKLERSNVVERRNRSRQMNEGFQYQLSRPSILYEPPKVEYRSADGQFVPRDDTSSLQYSLPVEPMYGDTETSAITWPNIPSTTTFLAHTNKYVLDSSKVIRSAERHLLVRLRKTHELRKIPLKGSIPQVVAQHPDHEWVVLGSQGRLIVMVGRS